MLQQHTGYDDKGGKWQHVTLNGEYIPYPQAIRYLAENPQDGEWVWKSGAYFTRDRSAGCKIKIAGDRMEVTITHHSYNCPSSASSEYYLLRVPVHIPNEEDDPRALWMVLHDLAEEKRPDYDRLSAVIRRVLG